MPLRHYFFSLIILFILSLQRAMADGDTCECTCLNRMQICDDLQRLQTEVDVNTGDRQKWNRHYHFLHNFHYHWKQEIVKVFNEEMEHNNGKYKLEALGPSSENFERNKNVSRSKPIGEKQNLENNIAGARLDPAEQLAKKLENDLRNERVMRKKFENEYRQQQLIIEAQREVLEDQVSRVEKRLKAMEIRRKNENEERKWLRSDIEEIRSLFRDLNPEDYSKKFRDLENQMVQVANEIAQEKNSRQKIESEVDVIRSQFRDLSRETYLEKLTDLENQVLKLGNDIIEGQNEGQKLETSVRDTKYALLKIKKILQLVVPPHALRDLVTYLNATLGLNEDSLAELDTWRERNSKPEETSITVTSRLEDLEAIVKVLKESLEEAVSRIKILENKYMDAMKSTVAKQDSELVESHKRHPISRAFDARHDP